MDDLNISISDFSIEVLRFKKNLFGKTNISLVGRKELEEGIVQKGKVLDPERLAEELEGMVKEKKAGFTFSDLQVFVHRAILPLDISSLAIESFIQEEVKKVVPFEFEKLIYDFKVVNESEKGQEVLFLGVSKEILAGYLKALQILKVVPVLAIPQSLAAFEIFRETIVEKEIILYINLEDRLATLSFFDKFGPFLIFNKSVEEKDLKKRIRKARRFLEEKYKKEIKRIILGGSLSLTVDSESFSKEIGIWTTKADRILEDKLTETSLSLEVGQLPPVLFLNVLGLALFAQKKEGLNLLKRKKDLGEKLFPPRDKRKKALQERKEKDKLGPKKGTNIFALLVILLATSLISFLGFWFLITSTSGKREEKELVTPSPTLVVREAPIFNRQDLKVRVLNGSGVRGEAKKTASFLEKLGYKVVSIGNAESFNYGETIVKIKKEKGEFFSLLKEDLGEYYQVSSKPGILAGIKEAEAVIIIGKKKKAPLEVK